MMNVTLAGVAPQRREGLTVFPLVSDQADPLPHQLLSDALAADSLNVLEVGEGTVPTLLVENFAPHPGQESTSSTSGIENWQPEHSIRCASICRTARARSTRNLSSSAVP